MKIILLEKIPAIGDIGTVANVRAGYARNYLFPRGKAERATPRIVAEFEQRRAELEQRQNNQQYELQQACEALNGYLLQLPARASADGSLYGSITSTTIAAALNAQKIVNIDIRRGQLLLPNGNLKEVGNHDVLLLLQPGIEAKITIAVLAEENTAAQDKLARKGDAL